MRREPQARRVSHVVAALAVGALAAVACTGSSADPIATIPTTTTEPAQPRQDDGVLHIGALIPINDLTIGAGLVTSFEDAIAAVNAAGGVLGRDVRMSIVDEGMSATSAAQATEELIEDGVDAIVGPTSSNSAIGALDAAVAAGIVTCSATATAISLDEFPDDGLFFRSVATDSLQASAIAREAENRGSESVVIFHIADAYGQPYADAVADALEAQPSIRVRSVAVPFGDDDLEDDLDDVVAIGADTAIVLGSGGDIARLLEAINARDDIDFNRIIVNDAARAAPVRPVIADLDPGLRTSIVGLVPQIVLRDAAGSGTDTPFATQITDCVTLVALSSAQGDTDSPSTIASQMTSVSSGGADCRTFAECVEFLDADEQIDYDGATSITELARGGDPSRAFFDRFVFLSDGSSSYASRVAVS